MAQYQTGNVAVTNGSVNVTGSAEVDWSAIAANNLFQVVDDPLTYMIQSVNPVAKTLVLQSPYQGLTSGAATYAIHLDYTPRFSLPLPGQGDIGTRGLIRRAFQIIDQFLGTGSGGGGSVSSIFGRVGAVVAVAGDYTLDKITDTATYVRFLATERSKLTGIAAGAEVNRLLASQAQAEAGTDNATDMSPLRTKQAITALAPSVSNAVLPGTAPNNVTALWAGSQASYDSLPSKGSTTLYIITG